MSFCGFSVYGTFSWFSDAAMASLVMAQTLVMMSVFCRSRHSLVMPRKILQIGEPGRTVEQFFHDVAWAKILAITSVFIVNCVADVPPARA